MAWRCVALRPVTPNRVMDRSSKAVARRANDRVKTNRYQRRIKSLNNALVALLSRFGFDVVIKRPRKMRAKQTMACFDSEEIHFNGTCIVTVTKDFEHKLDIRRRRATMLAVYEALLRTCPDVVIVRDDQDLSPLKLVDVLSQFSSDDDDGQKGFPISLRSTSTVNDDERHGRFGVKYRGRGIDETTVGNIGHAAGMCMCAEFSINRGRPNMRTTEMDLSVLDMYFDTKSRSV